MRETVVEVYDDIALHVHGIRIPGATTITLGWKGRTWTIDLAEDNEKTLEAWLEEHVLIHATLAEDPVVESPEIPAEASAEPQPAITPAKVRRRTRVTPREFYGELRAWAKRVGIEIKASGGTYIYPKAVVERFSEESGLFI